MEKEELVHPGFEGLKIISVWKERGQGRVSVQGDECNGG